MECRVSVNGKQDKIGLFHGFECLLYHLVDHGPSNTFEWHKAAGLNISTLKEAKASRESVLMNRTYGDVVMVDLTGQITVTNRNI